MWPGSWGCKRFHCCRLLFGRWGFVSLDILLRLVSVLRANYQFCLIGLPKKLSPNVIAYIVEIINLRIEHTNYILFTKNSCFICWYSRTDVEIILLLVTVAPFSICINNNKEHANNISENFFIYDTFI